MDFNFCNISATIDDRIVYWVLFATTVICRNISYFYAMLAGGS